MALTSARLLIALALVALAARALPARPADCQPRPAGPVDKAIAGTRKHSGRISGRTASEIAAAINRHLQADGVAGSPCSEFSIEELQALASSLMCHRSPELGRVYNNAQDPRALTGSIADMAADPTAHALVRDAHCAGVLQLWAHHVPAEAKAELKQVLRLPSLPEFDGKHASHPTLGAAYTQSFNCVSGHNMTSTDQSDHALPHWPEEVHYTGTGHGAYPFWLGGGGGGGSPAAIEVWWSEKRSAEKFYHSACAMTEAGYSSDAPCVHLMLGTQPSPTAYLYTHSEDFCCVSSPSGGYAEKLTPVPSNFMDKMTLNVNYGNISGTYYNGPVKQYLMTEPSSEPVTYFWYLTTMDDKPVQQGEGGFGGKGGPATYACADLACRYFDLPRVQYQLVGSARNTLRRFHIRRTGSLQEHQEQLSISVGQSSSSPSLRTFFLRQAIDKHRNRAK